MKALTVFLLTICLTILVDVASAGVVVTKDKKITLGLVKDTGKSLQVKVKYGLVQYDKDRVVWYSNHPKVTSRYMAGRLAEHQKKPRVAKLLYAASIQQEPDNKERAQIRLKRLIEMQDRELEKTSKPVTPADSQPAGKKNVAEEQAKPAGALDGHVVYQAFEGKLEHLEGRSLRRYDAGKIASAEFYLLYYSASWCGPCQAFTPQLVKTYKKLQKKYPNQFEIILVSSDRTEGDMKDYMRKKHMPWPAVKFSKRNNIKLVSKNSPRGIPHLVTLNPKGKVLASGIQKSLLFLQEELEGRD